MTTAAGSLAPAFAHLQTRVDVASLLGVSDKYLCFVLYGAKERAHYRIFNIPKSDGGTRQIWAPPARLAVLQRKVARFLQDIYRVKPAAHGFVQRRSIVTNAIRHERQRLVFNIDLQDFFHHIHFGRFINLLAKPPHSIGKQASVVLGQICFGASGKLPQGAPSSPIISNLICRSLDDTLQSLASRLGCRYTRYADDITFSTSKPTLPESLVERDPKTSLMIAGAALREAISSEGFAINSKKVRLYTTARRQEVTGLTVNERTNVQRRYVREIDSILHAWRKHGYEKASEQYLVHRKLSKNLLRTQPKRLLNVLRGKLSFLRMVKGSDDPTARRLHWKIHDLDGSQMPPPVALNEVRPSPLRGFSGAFHGWQKAVRTYSESVKYLQILRDGGVQYGASAYVISKNTLATAGHVAMEQNIRVGFETGVGLAPVRACYAHAENGQDWGLLFFDGEPFRQDTRFEFQYRLPEIGEEVIALGFPRIPNRDTTTVVHSGTIEALPIGYNGDVFIQTSFQSGGGLSGGPVIDKHGYVLGLMIENVFMDTAGVAPVRPYGQATPHEYVARAYAGVLAGRGGETTASGTITYCDRH